MAKLSETYIADFAERVEALCIVIDQAMTSGAEPGSARERIRKLKDEAADIAAGFSGHRNTDYALLKVSEIEEALSL